jgi:hypothetical protein
LADRTPPGGRPSRDPETKLRRPRLLLHRRRRGRRAGRFLAPARRAEGGAGEHAALRGRQDGHVDDIKAFSTWAEQGGKNPREIAYRPARVLMQDFTGVPAVVDLAAMRDGIKALGGDPQKINPLNPVDLVIDHSVMIDEFGNRAPSR